MVNSQNLALVALSVFEPSLYSYRMILGDDIPELGIETIDTDDICAMPVKKKGFDRKVRFHGRGIIVPAPALIAERLIIALRVIADCKTNAVTMHVKFVG